ncbi:MAG: NAD(P)-binding domain-containing protein [Candidatus Limnocylindrales bacterium]
MNEALPRSIETVVIGAGHAGLIMSWHLQQAGRPHVLLERREALGGGWQDRWDGFRLVTPNWITALPGYPYDGPDPDGFMDRESLVARFRGYAAAIAAPVHLAIEVKAVAANVGAGRRFRLTTSEGPIDADQVIVATGSFQSPRVPAAAAGISPRITQVHSHDYRNEAQLPPGGVLLIGSGQTGVQLAEELHEAGRDVILSVGQCGRVPRRYRGRDCFAWLRALAERGDELGAALPTVGQLPDPRLRFAGNPHLSGHRGGHDTNLRQMAADGIRLVGRFIGAEGEHATFAPDLSVNLQFADAFFDVRFRPIIDSFIERSGLSAPDDDRAWPVFEPPTVTELDLARAGISAVLWTSGYARDYSWLGFPILDDAGLPRTRRGVSEVPGLTFIGLLWQHTIVSANLVGVDLDAAYLASQW